MSYSCKQGTVRCC